MTRTNDVIALNNGAEMSKAIRPLNQDQLRAGMSFDELTERVRAVEQHQLLRRG